MNLNKVFIMGRLTADPEVRTTPSGDRVTTLSIATNRVWSDKSGGKKEAVEFHNAVLWGRQADVAGQFLIKGSIVFIEGRLQTRKWQGQDGVARRVTEIIGERMQLGPRPGGSRSVNSNLADRDDNDFTGNEHTGGGDRGGLKEDDIPIIEMGDDDEIKPENLPF